MKSSAGRFARRLAGRLRRYWNQSNKNPSLERLIAEAKLPRDARVLTIGRLSDSAKSQIDLALRNRKGPRLAVGDGERPAADPFTIDLPGDLGACFVTLSVSRIPDVFEDLLHHGLKDALQPGGRAVLQFCRDASEAGLEKFRTRADVREALRDFLLHHFGAERVSADDIAAKFRDDADFEFVNIASRTSRPARDEAIVWVLLRRRAAQVAGGHAFPRSPRADRYPQAEFARLIERMRGAGIAFLPLGEFVERLGGPPGGFGLLKFDIHHSIRRALEVGQILESQDVRGLFLMMHRHPLSAGYYDAPFTWQVLRALQDMGHEIGLHLDPIHMIREHGDLNLGLSLALADMRGRGLAIRSATLHGNTAVHLRARNLSAYDFFEETQFRSTWDGKPPDGEPVFAEHVRRYSFADLVRGHGLRWFAETDFIIDGKVLTQQRAYLSDNRKTMTLLDQKTGAIGDEAPFRISEAFAARTAEALQTQPFVALFHPQWIW